MPGSLEECPTSAIIFNSAPANFLQDRKPGKQDKPCRTFMHNRCGMCLIWSMLFSICPGSRNALFISSVILFSPSLEQCEAFQSEMRSLHLALALHIAL